MNIEKYIKESNAIEGIYDKAEIKQSLLAWRYLKKLDSLRHYDICRVHKIIMLSFFDEGDNRLGYYRNVSETNVKVGDQKAPHHSEVEGLMKSWLWDLPNMFPPAVT